ncbi:MAG: [FeFe] hydrogenase H-cluster radical SAM maturase HydE [Cyanobacteria bacterium SIG29]|nr:[FeFe] hydrogenase H-cluster radical SAM maturase HydE [Cyanobacteria bacterium SIG29]
MKLNLHKLPEDLDRNYIINQLKSSDEELFINANNIRNQYKKNYVHLRALIEFTNICKCNCLYCGLRCENKNIERYRLSEDEILNCVENAVKKEYKTIVLQGGEDAFWTQEKICSLIKKIKNYDVALTLSIGERSFEDYKAFKEAGADRYLLRIETTDKKLYEQMHPNMSFENRIRCLKDIKNLGYEVGTGVLVGLPNQSIDSLADDILFFKEIEADMVGIGPFIAHPDTPLAKENQNNFDLALRVMALTRIILPNANIPATTAMETLKKNGRILALNSGANVVMPNFTDINYCKNYEIYPNKASLTSIEEIKKIGRVISKTKGFKFDY